MRKLKKESINKIKISEIRGKERVINSPSNMRKARINIGISQGDMAVKIGLSRPSYTAIENGFRPVKENNAKIISKSLKSNIDSLFNKSGKKFIAK